MALCILTVRKVLNKMDIEKKFAKLSLITDVLSAVLLYVIHAVLIVVLLLFDTAIPPVVIYLVICAIITLISSSTLKDSKIAAVVLSPICAPFTLSRRLRPYTWVFVSNSFGIEKLAKSDLIKIRETLAVYGKYRAGLSSKDQLIVEDRKLKDGLVLGCRTYGETFDLYDHVLDKLGEKDPYAK